MVSSLSYGQAAIDRLEYFIDTDPGVGAGIPLSVTVGASINESFSISTTGLSEGIHVIGIRALNTNGEWSMREFRTFYM